MQRKKKIAGYDHTIARTKLYDVPAIELAKSIIEKDPEFIFQCTYREAGIVGIGGDKGTPAG